MKCPNLDKIYYGYLVDSSHLPKDPETTKAINVLFSLARELCLYIRLELTGDATQLEWDVQIGHAYYLFNHPLHEHIDDGFIKDVKIHHNKDV